MDKAIMMLPIFGPNAAMSAMASNIVGKAIIPSTIRMRI
jgi:hypothetical protein